VHSRRHGTDRSFLPFDVSIRSIIDKVTDALEMKRAPSTLQSVGIKIPSASYVGLQFAPKSRLSTKALAYTSPFSSYAPQAIFKIILLFIAILLLLLLLILVLLLLLLLMLMLLLLLSLLISLLMLKCNEMK